MRKNPEAQEIKVGPAIHTAFYKLQTINVAFHRVVVPFERQARMNSGCLLIFNTSKPVKADLNEKYIRKSY